MTYLKTVNMSQQDQMRELENQRKDAKGTIVHMHDKIKMMNTRL